MAEGKAYKRCYYRLKVITARNKSVIAHENI